jgi:tetratricopeptide (TPR) repeat protein
MLITLGACGAASAASAQSPGQTAADAAVVPLLRQGEVNEQQQQLQSAESSYRQALLLSPASLPVTVHLAEVLQKEAQAAAAVHYWQQALNLAPADAQICGSLANAYLANGDNTQAAMLLQSHVRNPSPDNGPLWIDLGTALARLHRFEEAIPAYQNALTYPAYADFAQLSLTKALLTLNRYHEAAPHALAYVQAHPSDAEAHTLLGIAEDGLTQLPQAEEQLRLAVSQNANDFDSQYHLGAVLRAEGKNQEALAPLLHAISLRPDSQEAHFQLARAYRSNHQSELAAHEESILVSLLKNKQLDTRVEVLGSQAAEAAKAGNLDQAAQLYGQILALQPDNSKSAYDLALVYEQQHDRKAERTLLERTAAKPGAIAAVYSQLGFLDIAEGSVQTGEQQLRLALSKDPQCVEALGNLGVLKARSGHSAEAVRLLQLSVEAGPQYEQGFRNLGLVLASTGDTARASHALQSALALEPDDLVAARALAAISAPGSPQLPK